MRQFTRLKQVLRQGITLCFAVLISWLGLSIAVTAPSHAGSSGLTPEDQLDRAYEYTERAGQEEEIYRERLEEGQDPESMPKPFRRIEDLQGQEVPETSSLETAVSKVRSLVEPKTDK
jgi:hypothetical protein